MFNGLVQIFVFSSYGENGSHKNRAKKFIFTEYNMYLSYTHGASENLIQIVHVRADEFKPATSSYSHKTRTHTRLCMHVCACICVCVSMCVGEWMCVYVRMCVCVCVISEYTILHSHEQNVQSELLLIVNTDIVCGNTVY